MPRTRKPGAPQMSAWVVLARGAETPPTVTGQSGEPKSTRPRNLTGFGRQNGYGTPGGSPAGDLVPSRQEAQGLPTLAGGGSRAKLTK